MQTFLPYPCFMRSAQVLDRMRLGKQRVEVKQIYNALVNNGGWRNHPAVRMWAGHECALLVYGMTICDEWIRRGYNDTLRAFFVDTFESIEDPSLADPPWLEDPRLSASHRSNLLRKLPEHYRQYWPTTRDDLPYFWPTHHEEYST